MKSQTGFSSLRVSCKCTQNLLNLCNQIYLNSKTESADKLSGDLLVHNSADIYLFEGNNANTITMCNICSKLTKTQEWRKWRCSGVFIINFKSVFRYYSGLSTDFEQLNVGWEWITLHIKLKNTLFQFQQTKKMVNVTRNTNTRKRCGVCLELKINKRSY